MGGGVGGKEGGREGRVCVMGKSIRSNSRKAYRTAARTKVEQRKLKGGESAIEKIQKLVRESDEARAQAEEMRMQGVVEEAVRKRTAEEERKAEEEMQARVWGVSVGRKKRKGGGKRNAHRNDFFGGARRAA